MPSQASSRISHQKTRRGRTGQDGPRMLGSPLPAARTRATGQSGAGFRRVAALGCGGQSRGRGLSRANDFFRGVSSRPKREKESDGCPPPLHPPPAGMQAYAVACMPQSTRRRLRSHRRLLFRKSEVSKGVSQTKASEVSKGVSQTKAASVPTASRALRVAPSGGLGSIKYGGTSR